MRSCDPWREPPSVDLAGHPADSPAAPPTGDCWAALEFTHDSHLSRHVQARLVNPKDHTPQPPWDRPFQFRRNSADSMSHWTGNTGPQQWPLVHIVTNSMLLFADDVASLGSFRTGDVHCARSTPEAERMSTVCPLRMRGCGSRPKKGRSPTISRTRSPVEGNYRA